MMEIKSVMMDVDCWEIPWLHKSPRQTHWVWVRPKDPVRCMQVGCSVDASYQPHERKTRTTFSTEEIAIVMREREKEEREKLIVELIIIIIIILIMLMIKRSELIY